MTPRGDFAVVWEDDQGNDRFYQILGRGFFANGTQRFADKTINTFGAGNQIEPTIGMADNGSFVVAWSDDFNNNDIYDIEVRGFNANGSQLFSQRRVNNLSAGHQLQPDVAVASNGDFVVAWADDTDYNFFYQVLAKGYIATGSQRFATTTLNEVGTASQYRPTVGIADDGSFAAAWVDQEYRITSRQFSALGVPVTGDAVLNNNGLQIHNRPAIDVTPAGEFVVIWQYLAADGLFGLRGRRLDGSGGMGQEFTVSAADSGDQVVPAVAVR